MARLGAGLEAFGLANGHLRRDRGLLRFIPTCATPAILGTVPWTSANRRDGDEVARFLETLGRAGPYWIGFACEDLDATEESLLRHNGVRRPGAQRGDCLMVPPEAAQGVRMSFVQA